MACFHPLAAWKFWDKERKRWSVTLDRRKGYVDLPAGLPCGGCDGCLLERSRVWAVRCMHEASLHIRNCFVTLTYDDAHLPPRGSLCKKDFQDFMKRLRKEFCDERIRYFHCGEYGAKFGRPHYHACLFGFDFRDKIYLGVRKGFPVWRSPSLEAAWSFGRSEIGAVSFESAAYVARYVLKKQVRTGPVIDALSREVVGLEKEYVTMSRRPGIGREWFEKFKGDIWRRGDVVSRGMPMKPPRYYDVALELENPGEFERLRQERRKKRKRQDETVERLADREVCLQSRTHLFRRS